MSHPKPPPQIEIWRSEVSNATQPPHSSSVLQPISNPPTNKLFWENLLSRSRRHQEKPKKEENKALDVTRTKMYDLTSIPDCESRGITGSMDLEIDEDSEDDVLKAKRERLERAARLLNGSKRDEKSDPEGENRASKTGNR